MASATCGLCEKTEILDELDPADFICTDCIESISARLLQAERERDEAATAIRAYLTRWEEIEPAVKGQALNAMAHGLTYTEEEISAAPQFEALRAWLERYDAKEVKDDESA